MAPRPPVRPGAEPHLFATSVHSLAEARDRVARSDWPTALVDERGVVVETNGAWTRHLARWGPGHGRVSRGADLFHACDRDARGGDQDMVRLARRLRSMLSGRLESSELDGGHRSLLGPWTARLGRVVDASGVHVALEFVPR